MLALLVLLSQSRYQFFFDSNFLYEGSNNFILLFFQHPQSIIVPCLHSSVFSDGVSLVLFHFFLQKLYLLLAFNEVFHDCPCVSTWFHHFDVPVNDFHFGLKLTASFCKGEICRFHQVEVILKKWLVWVKDELTICTLFSLTCFCSLSCKTKSLTSLVTPFLMRLLAKICGSMQSYSFSGLVSSSPCSASRQGCSWARADSADVTYTFNFIIKSS